MRLAGAAWTEFDHVVAALNKGGHPQEEDVLGARAELDHAKRKQMYRDAAMILRDEGGVIVPMFNNYIDATTDKVGGWIDDPNGELMGGHALSKCWLNA